MLASNAKTILVLTYLTVFINFWTQKIFYKIQDLFPYKIPESKFDLAIKNSRSTQGHH